MIPWQPQDFFKRLQLKKKRGKMGEFIPPRKLTEKEQRELLLCPECKQTSLKSSMRYVKTSDRKILYLCYNCQEKLK